MAVKKKASVKATPKGALVESSSALPIEIPDNGAMIDFEADSSAGMEGADVDSFATPFLRVLQKISPQCDEAEAEFIEGAKGGMFLNTVTGETFDGKGGVIFLPCAFQRRFLQWAPRGSDRGFCGEHFPEDVAGMKASGKAVEIDGRLYVADEAGNVSEKKSDILADTRSHFGMLVGADGRATQVLFTLSSTQIKKSKQLMTLLNNARVTGKSGDLVKPPTWMNMVRITTVLESNDQGSWYGVKFEAAGILSDPTIYKDAKDFHTAVAAGEAKANFAASKDEGGGGGTAGDKF